MAPLADQPISIAYGGGVDTKTDSKQVAIGKMLRLENAIFTDAKRINKRNGNTSLSLSIVDGGTLSSPQTTKAYGSELVCAGTASGATYNGQRLFSYSPSLSAWADKGKYVPVKISNQNISQDSTETFISGASSGNYTASAWITPVTAGTSSVYVKIIDTSSNVAVLPETLLISGISGSALQVSVVSLATNVFGVLYPDTSGNLGLQIITLSGTTVIIGSEIVLQTDLDLIGNTFYAVSTTVGAAITYTVAPASNNQAKLFQINSSGSIVNTITLSHSFASSGNLYTILNTDSASNFWIYIRNSGTTYYAVVNSSFSTTLAFTNTSLGGGGLRVAAQSISSTSQKMYFQDSNGVFNSVTLTSAGVVGSPTLLLAHGSVYSQPFIVNGATYIVLIYHTTGNQDTLFIVDVSDGYVIGKIFPSQATIFQASGKGNTPIIFPIAGSSTKVGMIGWFSPSVSNSSAAVETILDFNDFDLYQSVLAGQSLLWNGGMVTQYDGLPAVELGFMLAPEINSITPNTSGGGMADGTYEYFIVFRWYDNNGNLYQSAPSIGQQTTITGGGGNGSVALTILCLGFTNKKGNRLPVQIAIFRTDANGTLAHLVNVSDFQNPPLFNNDTGNTISYTDVTADSGIDNNELLYTTGGVLENIAPPSTVAMTSHNNRVFLVDSENPNTIWYCKTIQPGIGISFTDLLTVQVDAKGGNINALAEMDEKLVILEERLPLILSGDGANDLGENSTFSFPQPVPTDVGCQHSKGVFTSPLGVHFKTTKGLYLLDRSTSIRYWGADVEQYNSQNITSALIMPGTTQMRFLTDSGLTLVYDYFFNQWSTFTNFQGLGADIWQSQYTYARSDGKIYTENFTSFLDDTSSIAMKAQFGWIKGAVVQGFQRVKQMLQLGDFSTGGNSAYAIQVSEAYDYLTNPDLPGFSTPIPFIFSSVYSSSGSFEYREFLEQQKCEAVSFLIEELPTGTSGESLTLTDMTLVAGIKKGAFKIGSDRTVA